MGNTITVAQVAATQIISPNGSMQGGQYSDYGLDGKTGTSNVIHQSTVSNA